MVLDEPTAALDPVSEYEVYSKFNEIAEDKMNFVEHIDIDLTLLSDAEKEKFVDGIRVYGKEEVSSLIEDYNS